MGDSKLKLFFGLLKKNMLFKIKLLVVIFLGSTILYSLNEDAYLSYCVMVGSAGLLTVIAVMYILSAWIINPLRIIIRIYKEKKKQK